MAITAIPEPVANQSLKAAKVKGRIVNAGRLGGIHVDFNFDLHAAHRTNGIYVAAGLPRNTTCGIVLNTLFAFDVSAVVRTKIVPSGGLS